MAVTATAESTALNELREKLTVSSVGESVGYLNFLVYGDPGAGKTYLGGTAEDHPDFSPMLIANIEGGLTTLRHRPTIDAKSIKSMRELEKLYNDLYTAIHIDPKTKRPTIGYKTVMIDSITELADLDMRDIMKDAWSKNPDRVDQDVPSQREWGKTRNHIRTIVRAFRDLPCHVIYTAHVGTLQEEGQPTKMFPGFSGKLRTEVPGFMDIVGYLYADKEGDVISRKIQFAPTRRVIAKDRTGALGDLLENPNIGMMWDLIQGKDGENK